MDKISIIIPVYNSSKFLEDCYGSLKRQTYSNLEFVFINDGSTDNSLDLLKGIAMADERVVVIDQKNKGLSAARNAGIKKATGAYLTFLDADDFLADDAVQYLYDLIKKDQDIVISACSHVEYFSEDKQKSFNNGDYKTRTFNAEDGLKNMLNERGFNLQSTAKMYKKDLFGDVVFPEGKLHEDVGTTYKLFINAYKKGARIAYGSKSEYYYRMREDSLARRKFNDKKLDLIALTDQMCGDIDAIFEDLKNTTNLRRLHARFSILRMLASGKLSEREKAIWDEQRKYILEHKAWLNGNPEATKRDKLAFTTLKLGKTVFSAAWKIHEML